MLFLLVWVIGFSKNVLGVIGDNCLSFGCFSFVVRVMLCCFSLTVIGDKCVLQVVLV